jgi:hypothetical protein
MSTPVTLRNQYGDLYGSSMLPVLEELFKAEVAQHPSRRNEVFQVKATDRDIWQASEIHDLDLFNEVAEGENYNFKRAKQGASKTLTIKKYGLGFSISEEAVEDGKFDMIADMTKKLARSGRESQEINAMAIFNNGFSTETAADGQPVFDTAHTLPSGVTFRNELSSAADLSATSLEAMLTDFETQFVGDSGIIYNIMPKTILVHPSNKRLAKELIGSELKVNDVSSDNSGTNAMNSFREEGLRVISSPHLTDTDAWFMLGAPEETGLRIIERKPLETKAAGADVGFATDAIFYKARYREEIGVTHPYGIFGSPGA